MRPSDHPRFESRRNAATRSFASGSSSVKFSNKPMRRTRSVCCERATSGKGRRAAKRDEICAAACALRTSVAHTGRRVRNGTRSPDLSSPMSALGQKRHERCRCRSIKSRHVQRNRCPLNANSGLCTRSSQWRDCVALSRHIEPPYMRQLPT